MQLSTRMVGEHAMDWNQAVDIMGNIAGGAWSRSNVVEGVYLAMRVMSHRAVLASNSIAPEAYLRRGPESSPESRRLALRIVEEVLSRESVPLDEIPQETIDLYINALWE